VSYKKMVDISNAVKSALDNYQGISDSVQFEEIRFVTLRDEGVDVAGNVLFARVLTFFAHVYENQAT
jgi:hypothetical protein